MALTAAAHLPDDGTGLARTILAIDDRVQRLEAARRIAATGLSSATQADAHGGTPVLTLATADLGYGPVTVQLRGQSGDNAIPASILVTFPDDTTLTLDRTGAAIEPWTALTPANGWTAAGNPWLAPVHRRQADGTVAFAGEIAPGTLTTGTVIATLADTRSPSGDVTFRVPGGTATAYADLCITTGGNVVLQNTAGTITRLGLTAVRYPL